MFQYDSPIMSALNKLTDIILLNICTLICCLPIITIGASLTAAHYTALKMHRDTDNYVIKNFFHSFRQNLIQSTGLWLLWAVIAFISLTAYQMYGQVEGTLSFLQGVVAAFMIFLVMIALWMFPVQARFINPIRRVIMNAFTLSFKHFIRTVLMIMVVVLGACMWLVGTKLFWIPLLFGFSVPIYLCAMIYNKVFLELEEKIKNRLELETEPECE